MVIALIELGYEAAALQFRTGIDFQWLFLAQELGIVWQAPTHRGIART